MKCPDCKVDMIIVGADYEERVHKCPECGIEVEDDDNDTDEGTRESLEENDYADE